MASMDMGSSNRINSKKVGPSHRISEKEGISLIGKRGKFPWVSPEGDMPSLYYCNRARTAELARSVILLSVSKKDVGFMSPCPRTIAFAVVRHERSPPILSDVLMFRLLPGSGHSGYMRPFRQS